MDIDSIHTDQRIRVVIPKYKVDGVATITNNKHPMAAWKVHDRKRYKTYGFDYILEYGVKGNVTFDETEFDGNKIVQDDLQIIFIE